MRRILLSTGLILLAACQLEAQSPDGAGVTFVDPFAVKQWREERSSEGCVVRAHALEVVVRADGKTVVRSARRAEIGTIFTITVGGEVFRSHYPEMPAQSTAEILAAFRSQPIAHLEWREPALGYQNGGRLRHTDAVDLRGFAAAYDRCI